MDGQETYDMSGVTVGRDARLPQGVLLQGGTLAGHPAPMLLIDPETGRIEEGNGAAVAFYGYPVERLCGMSIDVINMLPRREIYARRQAAAAGVLNRFSMPHRLASGEVREMVVHSHPVLVGDRELLFSVVQDVTESARLGEAVRNGEERLDLVTGAATLGLWDWNVRQGKLVVNPGWELLLNLEPDWGEDGIGAWVERIHPEDRQRTLAALNAHLEGRTERYEMEYRLRDGKGTLRWIHDQGRVVRRDALDAPLRVIGLFMDVTARRLAEEARARLFELSLDMLCILGFDGRFREVNPAWSSTLGWESEVLLHTPLEHLVHEGDIGRVQEAVAKLTEGRRVRGLEVRLRCSDGTWRWLSWNARSEAEQRRVYAVVRDVTDQKLNEVELRRLASTDALTGVPNRAAFMDALSAELQRCRRAGGTVSVLLFDVDRFKLVNDTWGHSAGDTALRKLGKTVAGLLRPIDHVGRLGGEEFAVALPGVGPDAACCVAERLRCAIEGLAIPSGDPQTPTFRISVSVGVASCPPYHTADEVLRAADKALYRAKSTGRNRVVCGPVAFLDMACQGETTIP